MQDRYTGDVGDFVKYALLRALADGRKLGVAWYLYPDEGHNSDGKHTSYLDQPELWRHLDPELFDTLETVVKTGRCVRAIEDSRTLGEARFAGELLSHGQSPAAERSDLRDQWFKQTLIDLAGCDLVFADPDNGLIDDAQQRRRQKNFGKQMPLTEALQISDGRMAIIYHHNTRFPGGHDLEVATWQQRLGAQTLAVRANAYSCRTFFVLNADQRLREIAKAFCKRWARHKVTFADWLG